MTTKAEFDELIAALSAPFQTDQIHWRVGSTTKDKKRGLALAYVDARDVMDRLDGVLGPGRWQNRYVDAGNGKTCCEIGVWVQDEWHWKSDGAGDTGYEADKGAFSDAFKRAAVRWGVGRYLYGMGNTWVELDDYKNILKSEIPKLNAAHAAHASLLTGSPPQEKPKAEAPPSGTASKASSRGLYAELKKQMDAIETSDELKHWGQNNAARLQALPKDWYAKIKDDYADRLSLLTDRERLADREQQELETGLPYDPEYE